jgi:hypothetical protein
MSNYEDYFNDLANTKASEDTIDYGIIGNHKNNRAKRNYFYTHPNQLRPMTISHSKKTSHSKQNDLLGAIEMLTYKPPEILPISVYTQHTYTHSDLYYGSGKKKQFNIEETELPIKEEPKKEEPKKPTVIINQKTNKEMEIERFKENQKKSDKLLQKLVNQGVAKVYPKQTPPKVIHKKPVERSSTPLVRQSPPILQEEVKDLPKSNISKTNIQKFLDKQKKSDQLLQQLVKDKEAKVSNIPKDPPKPTKDPRIEAMLKRLNSATLPNQNLPMNRITSSN